MSEEKKFSDLLAEAVSDHGKATADLLRRVGRDDVDYLAEASNCIADVTRTVSRFLVFWDNIATLIAASPGGPLTFPAPRVCEEGETQSFVLGLQSSRPPVPRSGLRRRGEVDETIPRESITATTGPNGVVLVKVDCSGQPRGVYEGSMQVFDTSGNRKLHPYNVYINPGAQK